VVVTNASLGGVTWKTSFQIQGVIKNLWNASYTQSGNDVQAKGLAWNQLIPSKSSIEFGFCADRPAQSGPIPGGTTNQTETVVHIKSDWGTGYCADVDVKNKGAASVIWQVTLGIQGTVYNFWNANLTQQANSITASGADWNKMIPSGGTQQFGFCAGR
jgi:endoglucanase